MFRAMAMKELRETRAIALLALAGYSLMLMTLMHTWRNWPQSRPPFVDEGGFYSWFLFITVALAIALGLRQTLGESIPGTYPFLLHRPAKRGWLIGVKLLVGIALYLIGAAVPIVVYGVWAATPGMHPSPFEWSMTLTAWNLWLSLLLLYFGAFLTGIRPGRWWRSRVLPLAAAGLILIVVEAMANMLGMFESLWPCWVILVVDAWMIAMIFFTARTRDYS